MPLDSVRVMYFCHDMRLVVLFTGASGESGSVKVVLADFIIPALDGSREITVSRCKVLSKPAMTVLEGTVLKPVLTKVSRLPVPRQRIGSVERAVVVVVIQDSLDFVVRETTRLEIFVGGLWDFVSRKGLGPFATFDGFKLGAGERKETALAGVEETDGFSHCGLDKALIA